MWNNKSLLYPLLLLLLFVLSVVLGLGNMVDRAVLQDVRHTLMVEKAKWVADAMQKNLEETINHTSLFKESWVDSLTWLPPPQGASGAAVSAADTAQFEEKWEKVRQLFPLWQMDFLLIVDPSGGVLHQLPETVSKEYLFPKELLEMAQQELQTRELWMTLDRMEGQWAIQVFAHLPSSQSKGVLVVFGQYLEKIVTQLETDHPELTFLLAGDGELLGADPIARDPALLKPELIDQAIEENRPLFDDNTRLQWNLYYAPLQLLDQIVCLVIPIELKAANKILGRSQKKLRQAFWFVLLGFFLAGLAFTFLFFLPLRKLRAQAGQLLAANAAGAAPPDNELKCIQQALTRVTSPPAEASPKVPAI
ncbi:MAG: hypothetical protein HQL88_07755 [Magnetococcales bacterium]|nr:hypothetical protein [Magnetococcales bacterium]